MIEKKETFPIYKTLATTPFNELDGVCYVAIFVGESSKEQQSIFPNNGYSEHFSKTVLTVEIST